MVSALHLRAIARLAGVGSVVVHVRRHVHGLLGGERLHLMWQHVGPCAAVVSVHVEIVVLICLCLFVEVQLVVNELPTIVGGTAHMQLGIVFKSLLDERVLEHGSVLPSLLLVVVIVESTHFNLLWKCLLDVLMREAIGRLDTTLRLARN